jgi:uncharacterized protein (TIGR02246 family)
MTRCLLAGALAVVVASAPSAVSQQGATAAEEDLVRQPVKAFYAAFNSHGFDAAAEFATEDWEHINPFGGWTRGRAATVADLRAVHGTFLKGVTDTPDAMLVRMASAESAIVTVTSQVSRYVTPDGTVHENERHLRTFVVVKRSGRWLIMLDQNTLRR